MLPLGVILDRHVMTDPGQRNVGLRSAKILERCSGILGPACHSRGRGEHAVRADEIDALAQALPRALKTVGISPNSSSAGPISMVTT